MASKTIAITSKDLKALNRTQAEEDSWTRFSPNPSRLKSQFLSMVASSAKPASLLTTLKAPTSKLLTVVESPKPPVVTLLEVANCWIPAAVARSVPQTTKRRMETQRRLTPRRLVDWGGEDMKERKENENFKEWEQRRISKEAGCLKAVR